MMEDIHGMSELSIADKEAARITVAIAPKKYFVEQLLEPWLESTPTFCVVSDAEILDMVNVQCGPIRARPFIIDPDN